MSLFITILLIIFKLVFGLLLMMNLKANPKQKRSQRANNILRPVEITLKQKCQRIVAGALHSYAISKDKVYFWGKKMTCSVKEQNKPRLNPSNQQDKIIELAIKVSNVATGPNHTFAWNQKEVYCWGSNQNYELGLEEQKEYECHKIELFEEAMKNGYHLEQIECGQSHTLAIFRIPQFERQEELFPLSNSEITEKQQDNEQQGIQMFAWGKSESYQLTINSVNIIPYPVLTPCSFKHLTSVHSKSDYNAALCNEKVYTWGANLFSRLGNAQSKVRIPQQVALPAKICKIGIGNHHVVAVSTNGSAYSWGKGDLGQLGIDRYQTECRPSKMICQQKIIDAACGDLHTLVRLENNQLMSCGGNKNGALGHNNFDASDKKKRCKKLQYVQKQEILGNTAMIACGSHHNLVLNDCGVIFGWGNNDHYQILSSPARQSRQDIAKPLKKALQIIVDEQISKNNKIQQEIHQFTMSSYLLKLDSWKNKFNLFREQKAREEQQLMKEYDQIVTAIKNLKKI